MKNKILGLNLKFTSDIAVHFFEIQLKNYENYIQNIKQIIFLPCASTKPIQLSPTHCYLSPITRNYNEETLLLIVSEPLTIIPYLCKEYPNYEYKPKDLIKDFNETQIFINRLKEFKKLTPENIKCYYIGGIHHYNLLKKSNWNVIYYQPKNGIKDYKITSEKMHQEIYNSSILKQIKFWLVKITQELVQIDYKIY